MRDRDEVKDYLDLLEVVKSELCPKHEATAFGVVSCQIDTLRYVLGYEGTKSEQFIAEENSQAVLNGSY